MKANMKANMKAVFIIAGVVAAAGWGRAALSPVAGEYPFLGDVAGHQQKPSAALNASGGYIVWQNATATSGGERIMVQRLAADMTALGVPFRASQAAVGRDEENPRVAVFSSGAAIVVWEGGARSSKDIYVRILQPDGGFVSGDMVANSYAYGIQSQPSVTVLQGGNAVVTWTSAGQDGSGTGVYGQIFSEAGAKVGGEFLLNQTTAMNQSSSVVAPLANGGFVAGWVSESINGKTGVGAPNLRGNVLGRAFSASGQAVGNEFNLTGADAICSELAVGGAPAGGFTLAWVQKDEKSLKNLGDIYTRTFNSEGVPLGAAARLNVNLVGPQYAPKIQMLGNSGLVVWSGLEQKGAGVGIQGRMLSGGSEFRVNTQTALNQKEPFVISAGSEYVVGWVNTIRANHSIISAQRYSTAGGAIDLTSGSTQPAAISADNARGVSLEAVRQAEQRAAAYAAQQSAAIARLEASKAAAQVSQAAAVSSTQAAASAVAAAAKAATTIAPTGTSTRATAAAAAAAKAAATKAAATKAAAVAAAAKTAAAKVAATKAAAAKAAAVKVATVRPATTTKSAAAAVSSRMTTATRNTASAKVAASTPIAASLVAVGDAMQIQWASASGGNYQVQASGNRSTWQNIGSVRAGTGGTDSVAVDTSGAKPYYRVVRAN
jgi:hypothetical protein